MAPMFTADGYSSEEEVESIDGGANLSGTKRSRPRDVPDISDEEIHKLTKIFYEANPIRA